MNTQNFNRTNTLAGHKPSLQDGSIELVVLGMLAALIVVLAIPLFIDGPTKAPDSEKEVPQLENAPVQEPRARISLEMQQLLA